MNANRSTLFALGIAVATVCLIISAVYLVGGSPLGHHTKHALFFFGIAVVSGLFAALNRPLRTLV